MKRANEIIAETLGMEIGELNEYRYQDARTSIPVFAIGQLYYCCPPARMLLGKLKDGFRWKPHTDQFFAKPLGRTVYVASCEEE